MVLAARVIGSGEEAREDPFDVVADGPRLKVNGSVVSAKRLLARAHGHEVHPRLPDARPRESTVRMCSVVRIDARERAAELMRETMARAGVTCGDVGAALDLCERRVSEMRAGTRPISAEHVLLVAERLPAMREALLALLDARLRAEASR